jgi:hypothetical protein
VTIKGWREVAFEDNNGVTKDKFVLDFKEENIKPLVLNLTNGHILADIFGNEDFDGWTGKEIVLFNDKTVIYNGKVGGIRVRAPKGQEPVDDIPF